MAVLFLNPEMHDNDWNNQISDCKDWLGYLLTVQKAP